MNIKTHIKFLVILFLLGFELFLASALAQTCELDNVYLQAMPDRKVTITSNDDQTLELVAKAALNNSTRSAGFQRICESTIKTQPILFVFEQPKVPHFHMYNVVASIDIAFIDADGVIESIQSMKPYVLGSTHRPLYSPEREIIAALEAHQGFYQQHQIKVGDKVDWGLMIHGHDKTL